MLTVALVATSVLLVLALIALGVAVCIRLTDEAVSRRLDRGLVGSQLGARVGMQHDYLGEDEAEPSGRVQAAAEAIITAQMPSFDDLVTGRHARAR